MQVLRWSALVFGVIYGLTHQQAISSREYSEKIKREYEHKQSLIDQAKAAFVKKTMPEDKKTEGGNSMFYFIDFCARGQQA